MYFLYLVIFIWYFGGAYLVFETMYFEGGNWEGGCVFGNWVCVSSVRGCVFGIGGRVFGAFFVFGGMYLVLLKIMRATDSCQLKS